MSSNINQPNTSDSTQHRSDQFITPPLLVANEPPRYGVAPMFSGLTPSPSYSDLHHSRPAVPSTSLPIVHPSPPSASATAPVPVQPRTEMPSNRSIAASSYVTASSPHHFQPNTRTPSPIAPYLHQASTSTPTQQQHERLPSYKPFSARTVQLSPQGEVVRIPAICGAAPRIVGDRHPNVAYSAIVQPCPSNSLGYHDFVDEFTCLGVFCAIAFFPLGVLCCYACRERRCFHCGYSAQV